MEDIDDRTLKIIELAKQGVGGERETAIRLVKKMCAEKNLDYDDVMNSVAVKVYRLNAIDKGEANVLAHVIAKYAVTREHIILGYSRNRLWIYFTCTAARYIETANAFAVYQVAYRKEKARILKDLPGAFAMKHNLYLPHSEYDAKDMREPSEEELKSAHRQSKISDMLDDVEIRKAIGDGRQART